MQAISRPWVLQAEQPSAVPVEDKAEWLWLVAIIALGMALRWLSPAMKSDFWYDEVYSYIVAGRPLRSMMYTLYLGGDTNPPLYTVLLHFWIKLGDSDTHVKLFSLLFAVSSMVVLYLLARRIGGRRVATLSCLLFAASQSTITYGVEARPYSLFLFLSLLSTYQFLSAIHEDLPQVESRQSFSKRWLAYSIASVLTLYTHWFGLLLLFVQATALVIYRSRFRRIARPYFISIGMIASCSLPLAPFLWNQISLQSAAGGYSWPGKPGLRSVIDVAAFLAGGRDLLWIVGAIFIAACVAVRKQPVDQSVRRYLIFFVSYLMLPVILVFTASNLLARDSFFVNRYFLPFIVGVHILAALSLSCINRRIAFALSLVFVLFPLVKAVKHWRTPETPYSQVASELPAGSRGDILIAHLSPMSYYPVLHYRKVSGATEKILVKSTRTYEVSYNLEAGMLSADELMEVGAGLHNYTDLWVVIDPVDRDNRVGETYDYIQNDSGLILESAKQVIGLRLEHYKVRGRW